MFGRKSIRTLSAILVVFVFVGASGAFAAINYTGAPYNQTFDTLPSSGLDNPWSNNSTLPGWSLFRQPAPGTGITSINAGSGTNNAGSFYSFTSGDSDQALGGVATGTTYWGDPNTSEVAGWIALALTNSTGSSIDTFTLNYEGEQWRDGGVSGMVTPAAQSMAVEYGFGNTFDSVATWNPAGAAYTFASPIFNTSATALNGNLDANRLTGLGGTISSVDWNTGDTLWIRWIEINDFGFDHGLAIDNLNFSTGTVVSADGDFDADGDVDGNDFLSWQRGTSTNGVHSPVDLAAWQTNYFMPLSTVVVALPEPTSISLLALAMATGLFSHAHSRGHG